MCGYSAVVWFRSFRLLFRQGEKVESLGFLASTASDLAHERRLHSLARVLRIFRNEFPCPSEAVGLGVISPHGDSYFAYQEAWKFLRDKEEHLELLMSNKHRREANHGTRRFEHAREGAVGPV